MPTKTFKVRICMVTRNQSDEDHVASLCFKRDKRDHSAVGVQLINIELIGAASVVDGSKCVFYSSPPENRSSANARVCACVLQAAQ